MRLFDSLYGAIPRLSDLTGVPSRAARLPGVFQNDGPPEGASAEPLPLEESRVGDHILAGSVGVLGFTPPDIFEGADPLEVVGGELAQKALDVVKERLVVPTMDRFGDLLEDFGGAGATFELSELSVEDLVGVELGEIDLGSLDFGGLDGDGLDGLLDLF